MKRRIPDTLMLCCLTLVASAHAYSYGSSSIEDRLHAETVLPAHLDTDTATFAFRSLTPFDTPVTLSFHHQDTGHVPRPPLTYTIAHSQDTQYEHIDISSWPDGTYIVTIAGTQPSLVTGRLIRAIRKQTLPQPEPPLEPIEVAGMTTLFVDDWYLDTQDGLERRVQPADLLPILPWKRDASRRRYAYDIEDIRSDGEGALYVKVHAHDNGADPLHFWLKNTEGERWEEANGPPSESGASDVRGLRVLPQNTLITPGASAGLQYRLYDPLQDGPVDLQQVEVWMTPSRRSSLGDIDVPPRSRVAVWKRPDGDCLVLGDPTNHPITKDKWRFKKDDVGTWRDSNDNFGPQLLSADNRTLRFFQTRSVPRHEPYRVFYDNIFVDRIMTCWSSSDGMRWSPSFFEIPDARQGSPGLQHYGVYLFPEENATLHMAYVRMYDAVSQKTHTDVAYSRDGVLWNRLKEQPPFLSNRAVRQLELRILLPRESPHPPRKRRHVLRADQRRRHTALHEAARVGEAIARSCHRAALS